MADTPSKKTDKPGAKRAKVKLSKEQKLYVQDLVKLENRIRICREYIELWMEFFRFFAEIHEDHEITPADEKAFFNSMTMLARKHFLFVELMGDAMDGGGADVLKVISSAVSLSNIKQMQENTRDKLELDWHNQFLTMNKALGRLLRLMPGTATLTEMLALLKAGKSLEPEKKKKK